MASLTDYLLQDLIPATFNTTGLFFPAMHVLSTLALLGACVVQSALGLPPNPQKRDTTSWIQKQTPISWNKIFCNIGPNGCLITGGGVAPGVVVASPSRNEPDYFYTWTRDAALVYKGLADALSANYTSQLNSELQAFVISQAKLQTVGNPSGGLTDGAGLGEPKFMVNLNEFKGEWGRPQRDCPPLRAITLIRYAKWLIANGYQTTALNQVWPTIRNDLSYTAQYWNQTGFDLWEEVPGSSFFTIVSSHRALIEGAQLAATLGQPTRVYTTVAPHVLCFQQSFWNPQQGYMVSNINGGEYRSGKDANSILASIHNFDATAGCDVNTFQPCSDKALSNHKVYVDSFRSAYGINRGVPQNQAVAVGRYTEDVFYNGNPWFLATFAAAEQLYDALLVWKQQGSITVTGTSLAFFRDHVPSVTVGTHTAGSTFYSQIISAITAYADGFIDVAAKYAPANGDLNEQYNRNTGVPLAAPDLTWSYSAFLTATARREGVIPSSWGASQGNTLPSQCQRFEIAATYSAAATPAFPGNLSPNPGAGPAPSTIPTGCTNPEKVFVTFNQRASTQWGQTIRIVGNVPELGGWNTDKSIPLSASGYKSNDPLWTITVPIAAGSNVQYKFIRVQGSQVTWESDPNRSFTVPGATCNIQTHNDNWK